jgi:5-methylcytosine-specific restriction endonuclease McrA
MPAQAPRFCVVPGCSQHVTGRRRCLAHAVTAEHARPNYAVRRWYRTPRWQALRARILRDAGYACALCGQVTLALDVDHILRHQGIAALFWDAANLQPLCRRCHARKTQRGE